MINSDLESKSVDELIDFIMNWRKCEMDAILLKKWKMLHSETKEVLLKEGKSIIVEMEKLKKLDKANIREPIKTKTVLSPYAKNHIK